MLPEPTLLRRLRTPILAALLAIAAAGAWAQPAPPRGEPDPAWQRLTPDQREQLWREMTPEQRAEAWRRLPPEQRQAIRDRLTPEQRDAIRQRWQERREKGELPARRMTPEERRQLRDQIRESNRARPPLPEKKGR